ncbi:caudovirus prohead protease family protein [Mycobacterium kansasii]|uniref:Caudovirus prohead protease family protein n=1 Tax=Mycobacterium kansasii TaxID=1768 RepID=A0A1V3XKE7_MYCKA|nr:caudovirus prohead protease family protein [Mycobacterium kansasii]
MTSAELPPWVHKLPDWIRDDEVSWLAARPWIVGFIRADDYSLNPAIERFERSQRRMPVTTRTREPHLLTVRGLETTSLRFTTAPSGAGVVRSVSVQTNNAGRIRGIAVPYTEPSTLVVVAGIVCREQFDRHSLTPLPPSLPLNVAHDAEAPPLGKVTSLRHTQAGLAVEAQIDAPDRQQWLQRWIRGTWSSLSIAFSGAAIFDDWAVSNDGYPLRTVRGARLVEVSVVRDPAYSSARITEVLP